MKKYNLLFNFQNIATHNPLGNRLYRYGIQIFRPDQTQPLEDSTPTWSALQTTYGTQLDKFLLQKCIKKQIGK